MEKTFGNFLKLQRQNKGLTQKQLAEMLYVSESAVSKWEKNVAHPDITLLPKLSEVLGVSEHELITASIDEKSRQEKNQAKKWRAFSLSWSLFFYIAYIVALIPCFICNLVVNKSLTWFWIVFSALLLAFTFTNLPKLIKKYKLIFIPLSMFLSLCLLLGVCAIYTGGNWFWIPVFSVFFGLITIFMPIYICKYKLFTKIKKYADFVSVGIDFIALNLLLIVINIYTAVNDYSTGIWYVKTALPIVIFVYLFLNIILCIRFLKTNKLVKTGLILLCIDLLYVIIPFIKVGNFDLLNKFDSANIFKANLSIWNEGIFIERNINLIICLSILFVSLAFITSGIIYHKIKKRNK